MNVMRNGEGYHDPTAGVAIRNAFVPTVGHIYTNGSNPGYVVPLKIYEQVAVGYKLDTSIPYSSDYIIEVDNYMVDPRKVINIVTSRLGEDLGPLSPDDTKMLLEQLAKFCGGEIAIPDDSKDDEIAVLTAERDKLLEQVNKYQSLYEQLKAEKEKIPDGPLVAFDSCIEKPVELIRAEAERDTYKAMYTDMMKMLFMVEDDEC